MRTLTRCYLLLCLYAVGVIAQPGLPGAPSTSYGPTTLTGQVTVYGVSVPVVTLGQAGSAGATSYAYSVVAIDAFTHTYATAATTTTGNATLTSSNYNTITVGAFNGVLPYIYPLGGCDVYRTSGGATQGRIGTITCVNGGVLNDTGLVAQPGTPVPSPNTSGTLAAVNAGTSSLIASGTLVLTTSAISSATCTSAQIATASGVLNTDTVIVSFNSDPTAVTGYVPLTTGMLAIIVYPAANTVNAKVCNNTSTSITPGAITLNWRVVR